MQVQKNIEIQKSEIVENIERYYGDSSKYCKMIGAEDDWRWYELNEGGKFIDIKLYELIANNPLGILGRNFIYCVNDFFKKVNNKNNLKAYKIWDINSALDCYINDLFIDKLDLGNKISKNLKLLSANNKKVGESIDIGLIKPVYLSGCLEIN